MELKNELIQLNKKLYIIHNIHNNPHIINRNQLMLQNKQSDDIYNNTFNNINDYTTPSGIPFSLTNGNAIKSTNYLDIISKKYCKTTVITNPTINYTLNRFTNCYRAINTSRVEIEVKNNYCCRNLR